VGLIFLLVGFVMINGVRFAANYNSISVGHYYDF